MLLGLALDAWSGADVKLPVARVQLAERLGYDSVWTAEAYGADALTPLAYLAAATDRIKLATGVVQISARTPAATAMAFATLESLAGTGRVIAGLGLSGPQIVEGWYGQPWAKPIALTRDYVAIMRKIFRREGPVSHDGRAISLPYAGADATGLGKPLKSILHPNPALPIYLAAGGPENVALAAEVADGWIPMGLSPANASGFRAALDKGAARSGRALETLAIHGSTTVQITDDVGATIAAMKPRVALYVGGMGARDLNFHKDSMVRRGYADAAGRIQELFLEGRRDDATAAVPDEYVDEGALLGSPERIAQRFVPWTECGITGLTIHAARDDAIELMADLAEGNHDVTDETRYEFIAVDDPAPGVHRITLNRPEKRNAINNGMRAELFAALEAADVDDAVHVTIVRGAGPCFSSGYDLKRATTDERPYYTAGGDGSWSRHVTEGWVHIWDLAKPVIAQVHGYAMAGGTELVAACDLVYVAHDATFSYPVVRVISPPDFQYHPWLVGMRNAMELVLTGDAITGDDAVRMGLANRAFPADELDAHVVAVAARIAGVPVELLQINKRSVHRAMEIMGIRTGLRAGSELQGLASKLPAVQALLAGDPISGVKQAAGK